MARVMNSQSAAETGASTRPGAITFVCGTESRTVALDAPVPVLRGDRLMVSLMDLWVATLLPGDFLDLSFEVVVLSKNGVERHLAPVDALQFARGHLAIDSRSLAWEDGSTDVDGGAVVKIVVHDASSEIAIPTPPPVVAAPRASASSSIARLERMLPRGFSANRYPPVAWRFKKDDPAAARAIMMR